MSAGDNTRDDRWRPGWSSSERRVREELDETERPERRVYSRELAFVPAQGKPKFEPHDPQTRTLILEHKRLEELRHGSSIVPRLEEWKWIDAMQSPQEKQAYLEPLIASVRRDPVDNEDLLVFLLIALEPIRRGVSKRFVYAHGGIAHTEGHWDDRTQARAIHEIDRQTLYDVSRMGILEAIFLYPDPGPDRLFPWFRTVAARHALIKLRKDLSDDQTSLSGPEAEALQDALADFDHAPPVDTRDEAGLRPWRRQINLRSVYEIVEAYYDEPAVRVACRDAIRRLPRVQGEVIDGLFFRAQEPGQLALQRNVARSTIYNNKAKATKNMENDDVFFTALFKLGILRDQARAAAIAARYPNGRLRDGRRIVVIDEAA